MNAGTGFTMATPTFLGVNAEKGCTLADIKVTGYSAPVYDEEEDEWTGGCPGSFVLRLLNAAGTYESICYWVDDGKKTPGWYLDKGGKTSASDVEIKAGRGLWISGRGMTLVPAGEVSKDDVAFETNSGSGFTASGNCMPTDMKLGRLYVDGYSAPVYDEDEAEWTGGCPGSFVLRLLNAAGTYEGIYYWVDDGKKKPGWYLDKAGKTSANDVDVSAGRGLWCSGRGMTLNIPAPEL